MASHQTQIGQLYAPKTSNRRQLGITLIELMIAMTIGLVILLALSNLFLSTSRTNNELIKTNNVIENGRFALQLLQSNIAHAGFWGDFVPTYDNLTFTTAPPAADIPTAIPAPCGIWENTATQRAQWIGIPVQVYDATPAGCIMTDRKANTDVLLVRHAETCVPGVGACEALAAGRVYFQSSLCTADAATFNLNQLGNPGDLATSGFVLRAGVCGTTLANLRRLSTNIYFVRDDGVPTLMRTRFDGSDFVTEALIEGIEEFRIELGIDDTSASGGAVDPAAAIVWTGTTATNRGDGVPDRYVRCTTAVPCTAAQLRNATVVKLFVLARSTESTTGYSDQKSYCLATRDAAGACPAGMTVTPADNVKRHLFTTTIRLNNVSGRRETPA